MRSAGALRPFGLAVVVAALLGCSPDGPAPVVGFMAAVDDSAGLDDLDQELAVADTAEWVETYRPGLSSPGYNLVLYRRRVPMLIDMQGRVVHSWPKVRAVGRARLDAAGRLLVIGTDDRIKEYDWDGALTWAYALPRTDDLPHHDVIGLANGNVLVLAQETATRSDYLQEVDRAGRVVREWWPRDHLEDHFPDRDRRYPDPTHLNSLHELGPNRWFDAGDERFRPGNLLLSARNLDTVFVVERATGDIVWKHRDALDFQHEALMVPRGVLGAGLVVVFNNGTHDRNAYRRSQIRVVDPTDGRLVWEYSTPTFYTSVAGVQQVLPNGNLLVTSSEGGRAFEITPAKEKVWEWIPPYLPMRVVRYPPDHCPQLEALGPLDPSPVRRRDRQPWVDIELGQFAFRGDYRVATIHGLVREVLHEPAGCRRLLLPVDPVIQVAYGFDEAKLDGTERSARFRVTARDLAGAGGDRTVVDETIRTTDQTVFFDRYVAVSGLGLREVELCIASELGDGGAAFMTNPRAYSRKRAKLVREWKEESLSLIEATLQERQLQAIGYVQ
jgi:hypothetical protein